MNRRHVTVISLLLALALALGAAAVMRTAALDASPASAAPAGELAARNAQLDRYEAQLRAAARKRPPALTASTDAAAPERVVYVRPQPAAETEHGDDDGHDGRHESDQERDHGDDDD